MTMPKKFTKENAHNFPISFILSTIYRQHTIYLKNTLKPYDVSVGEYPTIMKLFKEGKKTQHELAEAFHMTEGTIARTVRNLEDKNIITRKIDKNNRRQNFVYITEKGEKIASLIENFDSLWEEEVCGFLNKNKKMKLKKYYMILQLIPSIKIKNKFPIPLFYIY